MLCAKASWSFLWSCECLIRNPMATSPQGAPFQGIMEYHMPLKCYLCMAPYGFGHTVCDIRILQMQKRAPHNQIPMLASHGVVYGYVNASYGTFMATKPQCASCKHPTKHCLRKSYGPMSKQRTPYGHKAIACSMKVHTKCLTRALWPQGGSI